ncbi:30S ribosomal protein S19, partial [Candidatus Thorarchaeota archaeon]
MSQKQEPTYRGVPLSELVKMDMDSLIKLFPARRRRTLRRGLPPRQKKLLVKLRKARKAQRKGEDVVVRTQCRDMIILPEMVDLTVGI